MTSAGSLWNKNCSGAWGDARRVLRDVWDDPGTEDLEPWLGAVRAQASRKLWAENDETMTLDVFSSEVDEAAPWLRNWLRPFVETGLRLRSRK